MPSQPKPNWICKCGVKKYVAPSKQHAGMVCAVCYQCEQKLGMRTIPSRHGPPTPAMIAASLQSNALQRQRAIERRVCKLCFNCASEIWRNPSQFRAKDERYFCNAACKAETLNKERSIQRILQVGGDPSTHAICTYCKKLLTLDAFHACNERSNSHNASCKACVSAMRIKRINTTALNDLIVLGNELIERSRTKNND